MHPLDAASDAAANAACGLIAPCGLAKSAVHSAANGAFQDTADQMFDGFDSITKGFLTSWTGHSFIVDIEGGASQWFRDTNLPLNVSLFTLGLIVAGIRIMLSVRGEPLKDAVSGVIRVLAITTAGAAAIKVFAWGSDAYSQYILQVSGVNAGGSALIMSFASNFPALALIFGLVGILAVACQWIIMIVRDATLPLLNAFWPSAAAGSLFERGQQAFEKVTSWIIAFLIYSPIAAAIYAYAWRLKSGDDGPGGVLTGLTLIGLAVLTLPALMRLLVPAVSAVGRASGGTMALGAIAAAVSAGVAVGAAVATGGGSAPAGSGAASSTGTAGTAAGGEVGTAAAPTGADTSSGIGGAVGGGTTTGADAAGGGGGSSTAGADGGDASDSSGGPVASGSSGSSSSGSRAGWAAAQSLVDSGASRGGTAEGMIGE
ncbi:hypothetical protein [Clavibacter michiganensis]|uniref:hypothetical protein n=1 Tax=Clavibacter michiganensis TaxID=28447 RepID=UPI001F5B266C|nr:hypothetical protein [Clavibacter michiganensis]